MRLMEFEKNQRIRTRERYDYKCYFCSKKIKKDSLANTVHHICPKSLGGGFELHNLVCLCDDCHKKMEKINRRLLFKLIKLDLYEKLEKRGIKSQAAVKIQEYEDIFKLKYKPNFQWLQVELNDLYVKKMISQDALNKIFGLKAELMGRLDYNHSIDMSHIEVLKVRIAENELKLAEYKKSISFYKNKLDKLANAKCLHKAERFAKELEGSMCKSDSFHFKAKWNKFFNKKEKKAK